jgi:hypothetical protein
VDIAPLPKGRKQITLKYKTKHALSGSHIHPKHNHAERNKGEMTDFTKKRKSTKHRKENEQFVSSTEKGNLSLKIPFMKFFRIGDGVGEYFR